MFPYVNKPFIREKKSRMRTYKELRSNPLTVQLRMVMHEFIHIHTKQI